MGPPIPAIAIPSEGLSGGADLGVLSRRAAMLLDDPILDCEGVPRWCWKRADDVELLCECECECPPREFP